MKKEKVIIIGAGLCGLYLAFLLQKKGIEVLLLEAHTQIGGRIKTITGTTGVTMEMGATWFGNQHHHLLEPCLLYRHKNLKSQIPKNLLSVSKAEQLH